MPFVEKDFLMRYFNQLGIVLARILGLKNSGKFEEANKVIEHALSELGLKAPEKYVSMAHDSFLSELLGAHQLNDVQIKGLAELLYEKGDIEKQIGANDLAKGYFSKTLILLDYITEKEKVYSFEREERICLILSFLNGQNNKN